MEGQNITYKKDFLIVGFSDFPHLQIPLFSALLLIYLATLTGNLLIMVTIQSDSHLHTPMYFFLANLSFLDISFTSVIFPQMLAHFFEEGTHVSLARCLMQMYFFMLILSTEYILLAVMAFDRYVAICNPLHYTTIMNKAVCNQLAAASWLVSSVVPLPHTILMSGLSFCESHTINHFFCDLTAILKMSCSNTSRVEALTYILGSILAVMSFILIIISYIKIAASIMRIKSKSGKSKTFSTCASHLTVVTLFYGSLLSTYMKPTSKSSTKDNKILSLLYIAVTPLCNPVIYSLKNSDFKNALRKKKNRR
ncbi:olfactory receptor 1E5-like [Lissotriton helveticus]